MKKRRINFKKGIIKTTLMVALALLFSVFIGLIANTAIAGKDNTVIQVTVKPGENLWVIAEKYNNKIDIRKHIFEIKELNNITDTIYPGQVLEIPIYN
ncbi:MAG: LysM peptidoglycan-binding domain-containing protein [Bacillota bacterium]